MAISYNVDQNKLTLIDGLLTRLLTKQKVDLKIDSKNQLEIPSDIKKKIQKSCFFIGFLNLKLFIKFFQCFSIVFC